MINISSIFGTSGGFGTSPAYHAAKGAVRTLTKNVAMHWATEGVRVNSVHPGFIRTPILDQAKGTEVWDAMTASTPMGRLGEPHEIAAAVAYLASDDASFVTGLRAVRRRRLHRALTDPHRQTPRTAPQHRARALRRAYSGRGMTVRTRTM